MKKHALALAVVTALSGTAFANGVSIDQGVGQQLIFPYFSAQGDGTNNENATLLTITNTDKVNAKLVKVRFRGASNSDDVLDFTLALSPADVWTGMVSKGDKGGAQITTYDASCTIPALGKGTPQKFILDRVKGGSAAETLEGYAEVITMADVPPTLDGTKANPLFATVKHNASGVATCSPTVFDAYLRDVQTGATASYTDTAKNGAMVKPSGTGHLTGEWTVINQKKTAAWSGSAVSVATTASNIRFWPQLNVAVTDAASWTTDPLLVGGVNSSGTAVAATITPKQFDLPDLSTSYGVEGKTDVVTEKLATPGAIAQYWTEPSINAMTDMVFSQPTRRYHVAYDYAGNRAVYKSGSAYYNTSNTNVNADKGQVCLKGNAGIIWPAGIVGNGTFASASIFDREEYTSSTPEDAPSSFVISPNTAPVTPETPVPNLCGEVAVMSVGAGSTTSALSASLTRYDGTPEDKKLVNGWMQFGFKGTGVGLPVLSASMIRVANGPVNYGIVYNHK